VRHSRPPLTAKQVNSDTPWFCCADCSEARPPQRAHQQAHRADLAAQVAAALSDETNSPRRPLEGHPQYTFELVRHEPDLPPGRDPGCSDYAASVVSGALMIFASSFAPLILDDGRDMCACVPDC